jgi:prephenate dehydrogenase
LITDVGSTKAQIVDQLQGRMTTRPVFVGSHPLAGRETPGVANAVANLFEGRLTVVTPTAHTPRQQFDRTRQFWASLGAEVVRMTPQAHDATVAMTSHTTHIVAAALAAATSRSALPLAATGWLDTTRIAAGDPALWQQILLANRDNVLQSLASFEHVLVQFRSALQANDQTRILRLLQAGKKNRDALGS